MKLTGQKENADLDDKCDFTLCDALAVKVPTRTPSVVLHQPRVRNAAAKARSKVLMSLTPRRRQLAR